jgi:hypothetical protein
MEIPLNRPSTFAKPTANKSGTLGEKDGMRGVRIMEGLA